MDGLVLAISFFRFGKCRDRPWVGEEGANQQERQGGQSFFVTDQSQSLGKSLTSRTMRRTGRMNNGEYE